MTENWIEIEHQNFKMKFPGPPTYIVSPSPDADGGVTYVYNYIYEPPGVSDINFLYGITFFDYPEGIIHHTHYPTKVKHFLDANANLVVSNITDGRLIRSKSTSRPTFSGRLLDVASLNDQFYYKIHMLLSESRLYIIQTVTLEKWRDNDLMKKFIASFSPKMSDQRLASPNSNQQSDF